MYPSDGVGEPLTETEGAFIVVGFSVVLSEKLF